MGHAGPLCGGDGTRRPAVRRRDGWRTRRERHMGGNGIRRRLTRSGAFGRAALAGALAAGLAVPLAMGVPGPAGPVSAAASGWHVQPTPNLPSTGGVLAADSCASPTACMAVGSYQNGSLFLPLAEAWNGTSWSVQPTPNPANPNHANLTSVSCTSPSACTAVGTAALVVPIAERWNGTSWSLQRVPAPAGAQLGLLASVSCPSAASCVAVGNYRSRSGTRVLLAETWNGTAWAIRRAAVPPGARRSFLNGVSCLSPGSCTAVGNYQSGKHAHVTLAERWNGASWSMQPTPNPPPPHGGLASVPCPPASI